MMIFKKKFLVLCALGVGFINSAMSDTVLQCPKSSNMLPIMQYQGWSDTYYTISNGEIENNWDVLINRDNKFTHSDEVLAGMPDTALLTISIDSVTGKETCLYRPFTQGWNIILTSKQAVDFASFQQLSKFSPRKRYNATGRIAVSDQLVCQTNAGIPGTCYQ